MLTFSECCLLYSMRTQSQCYVVNDTHARTQNYVQNVTKIDVFLFTISFCQLKISRLIIYLSLNRMKCTQFIAVELCSPNEKNFC